MPFPSRRSRLRGSSTHAKREGGVIGAMPLRRGDGICPEKECTVAPVLAILLNCASGQNCRYSNKDSIIFGEPGCDE